MARLIPVLLLPALAACGTGPAPAAGPALAVQKEEARPDEGGSAWKERLKSADVIFEGVLKPTGTVYRANASHNLPVIAGVDTRFLIEVEINKVTKGDKTEWSGTRSIAIHSPARSFMGQDPEIGKAFVFYLWKSTSDPKRYVSLMALPLP